MKKLLFAFKRECWEYHASFFTLPLLLIAILLALPVLGLLGNVDLEVILFHDLQSAKPLELVNIITQVIPFAVLAIFALFSFIVQAYYLINCLAEEKRDLSVMFWRSLPVSDWQTIWVKLVTGALLIPSIYMLGAAILYLCLMLLSAALMWFNYQLALTELILSISTLVTFATSWLLVFSNALWLLPLYTWLMLASIMAKKSPFLWAIVPVATTLMIESIMVSWFAWPNHYIYNMLSSYFWPQQSFALSLSTLSELSSIHKPLNPYGLMAAIILLYTTYCLRKRG